jgi:hypothetical protein
VRIGTAVLVKKDKMSGLGLALLQIVRDSLIASPEDAHLKVFQFLHSAGASEEEKKLLQTAWTRVSMANEAFGKKGGVDAELFGSELVKELAADKRDLAKIEEMITSFQALIASRETNKKSKKKDSSASKLNSIYDLKKSGGVLANLTSMAKVGNDITNAQNSAYPSRGSIGDSAISGSIEAEESVLAHRRSARTAKFLVHGRKPHQASALYSPLCVKSLGMAEIVHGDAQYKHSIALTHGERTAKASNTPIIVLKITSKQPSIHSKAFITYQCLHEILPSGDPRLRMFPVPLGCQRHPDQAGPNLVFELPVCKPLAPMLGSALSVYLRKYPSIVLSWCAQIGATMRSFRNCISGCPVRLPTLQDVYISENGHLTVGNTVFEECEDNSDSGNVDIAEFFRDILTSSLSLSRSVNCMLQPSLTGADENEPEPVTEEEETAAQLKAAKRVDAAEQVISIVEGNELDLLFKGHHCHGIRILRVGDNSIDFNKANLQVHVYGESATASLSSTSGDSVNTTLKVTANKPGSVLLRVVAQLNSNSNSSSNNNKSNINFLALDIRLIVVPAFPVQSPALLEVIAKLQSSQLSRNNDMFMSSHAIRLIHPETGEPAPDAMQQYTEVQVHNDWTQIRLQMDQHIATGGAAHSKSIDY